MAARNAVAAATMVVAGFTGVDDAFAGPNNFYTAFGEEPRPEALAEGLGSRFEIMEATIKKWCVGSPIQAALDALSALMTEHGIGAQDVERLIVRLPDDRAHVVNDRDMPDICLQHLLAVMLLDGGLSFAAAHDYERMADPAVLALRGADRADPERRAHRGATAAPGDHRDHHQRRTCLTRRTRAVRGTPDDPMERSDVAEKALDLLAPVLGQERAEQLIETIWAIERLPRVSDLRPLLQA